MQKLAMMKQLTEKGKRDPKIHNLVGNILFANGVRGKDQQGEIQCIVDWTVANVAYRRDIQNVETFQDPWYTITSHRGDCDDFSVTIAAMLESLGYRTQYKVIETTNSAGGYNHVYLVVELPRGSNRWVPIDATMPEKGMNGFGWEAPSNIVRRSMTYSTGNPIPRRSGSYYPGLQRHGDWTGGDMVYENMDGLGSWVSDLVKSVEHSVQVNFRSLQTYGSQATNAIQHTAAELAHAYQVDAANAARSIDAGLHDLTKLQLPSYLRNSPVGTYLTQKAQEAEQALSHLLPNTPLKKAVAWMLIGNVVGAAEVVKAHQDEVIRDLPPYARDFVLRVKSQMGDALEGRSTGLGEFGELDGIFTAIANAWNRLSKGKKAAIIGILVVALILYIVCAIYGGCTWGGLISWATGQSAAGASGGVIGAGLFGKLISDIMSLFRSDPTTPPAVATQPPGPQPPVPPTNGDPNQGLANSLLGAGSSKGLGVAGAVLLGLLMVA